LNPLQSYKFVLQDAFGNLIWTEDNIQGAFGVASNIVPAVTNTYTLGTPAVTFANGYFGPNGAPVFDPTTGNIGYYARTAAEISAGVTPVNYAYAPGVVDRYGTNTTPGTTDMTAAIQSALNVAGRANIGSRPTALASCVTFLSGGYAFSTTLTVPMGDSFLVTQSSYAITIQGQGKEQTILQAIAGGAGFAGGMLLFSGGSSFQNMGTVRDLMIHGGNLTADCVVLSFAQMGNLENLQIRNCVGRGIYHNNCLQMRYSKIFIGTCGSPSVAQMEIDATLVGTTGGTTTTVLSQVWIQGGNSGCVAGLNIDRSFEISVINGAFESTGIPVQISSKLSTTGCKAITFDTVDFEQPTTAYIAIGFGLSGTNFVSNLEVKNCTGFSAGAILEAVIMQQCVGARFVNNSWPIGASMTSIYNLFGTNNIFTTIEPHPSMNTPGSTVPWVRVNNVPVRSAGPLGRWDQASSPGYPLLGFKQVTTLATWTPWVDGNSANQGGWYSTLIASNSGATTIFSMDGDPGMEISIIGDGFSTLLQGTTGQAFNNVSGANLLLLANHLYKYRMNNAGTFWQQLGTA
jgi:hypothetical protein